MTVYLWIIEAPFSKKTGLTTLVENRNNIVIENAETNINNDAGININNDREKTYDDRKRTYADQKKTYAEIVSNKKKPMTSINRRVRFIDENSRNEEKENNVINQEECSSHSF